MVGLRIELLTDNIAIQGEFAATFHNSRVQARGHAVATYLEQSHITVVREPEEFKHLSLAWIIKTISLY
jgi:hypothetical protein